MYIEILETPGTDYSSFVFDLLYSYCQYHNLEFDYNIVHNKKEFSEKSIKVLLLDIKPEIPKHYDIHNYDFVFLCNSAEHMAVSSDEMYEYLEKYSNVYAIVSSFVHHSFPFAGKIISYSRDVVNCKNWFVNGNCYTSHYYHSVDKNTKKQILYINGANRSQRQDWIKNISVNCDVVVNNTPLIRSLTDNSKFASNYDNEYINYCNKKYPKNTEKEKITEQYNFSDDVIFGKHGKHGCTRRGYYPISDIMIRVVWYILKVIFLPMNFFQQKKPINVWF